MYGAIAKPFTVESLSEIVASVEEAIFHQNNGTKQIVRAEMSSILRHAKTPSGNIDSNVSGALRFL